MNTLLLRLAGPLQSWGTDSRFETRKTEEYPTKSGIIGLLAAALGRRRDTVVSDLADLKVGIRIDQPGQIITDFHTARKDHKTSYLTRRQYLSDAVFVVGLASDDLEFLKKIEEALKYPEYPLFLGRRSCPPTLPIVLGIKPEGLTEALESEKWQGTGKRPFDIRLILEGRERGIQRRISDEPLSFDFHNRRYGSRVITERSIGLPGEQIEQDLLPDTEHDIMKELEAFE